MMKNRNNSNINGWLIINKPSGMTSNTVNSKIRYLLKTTKTGFLGTLDPFASGVLPIALGHATKLLYYIENSSKEYIADLCWGEHRDTFDIDGKVIDRNTKIPSTAEIQTVIQDFIGETEQTPPIFSAVKINGKRACDLTRKGIKVQIQPKKIYINSIKVLDHKCNITKIHVSCNKGVYIRSLAVDIAKKLNALCYLQALQRVKSYNFDIKNSVTLESLLKNDVNDVQCYVRPMDFVLDDIPALDILDTGKFFNGMFQRVAREDATVSRVYCNKHFVGLGKIENGILYPLRVFKD